MKKDYWVVEYSVQQQQYHIGMFSETVKINILNLNNKNKSDYVIIGGLFETYDEAEQHRNSFQKMTKLPVRNIL